MVLLNPPQSPFLSLHRNAPEGMENPKAGCGPRHTQHWGSLCLLGYYGLGFRDQDLQHGVQPCFWGHAQLGARVRAQLRVKLSHTMTLHPGLPSQAPRAAALRGDGTPKIGDNSPQGVQGPAGSTSGMMMLRNEAENVCQDRIPFLTAAQHVQASGSHSMSGDVSILRSD